MPDTVSLCPILTDFSFCEDDFPLLIVDAQLPQITGRHARRFNRYYQACAAAFESWCRYSIFPQAQQLYRQALLNAAPLPQWHASLQSTITLQKEHLLSLYTDTVLTGAQQRTHIRRADTWDLQRDLPVTVTECFPPHTPWRSLLLGEAEQQILQQEAQGIAAYDPLWRKKLRRHFRPQQFYLADNGLHFFFARCTIAPALEGLPTFCVPYNEKTGPILP